MTEIVNKDIRWGLFGLTINECFIAAKSSQRYSDEYDLDADETQEMRWEIEALLTKLCSEVEAAINKCRYDWLEDLINDCITDYAQIFPEIVESESIEYSDVSDVEEDDEKEHSGSFDEENERIEFINKRRRLQTTKKSRNFSTKN